MSSKKKKTPTTPINPLKIPTYPSEFKDFIASCYSMKPERLVMSELKWKNLVRSSLRGKNILLLGPAGQGKTLAAQSVVEALGRNDRFLTVNMGGTQDARTSLIGNTHFDKTTGTFFDESPFVKFIQIPNSVILLDELSRGQNDGWNILLPIIDYTQRYLRLDEKVGKDIINVADGVCFIATANVGSEFTATRVMDRALLDRFTVKIEVDNPTEDEETKLVEFIHPECDKDIMKNIIKIAQSSRKFSEEMKIAKGISTRSVVEMAELTIDGFNLEELAEMVIYPDYSSDGGVDSERTVLKQLVQKYISDDTESDSINKMNDGMVPF